MSMPRSDKLFLDGISSLKAQNYLLAERKFRETMLKRAPKYEKAELLYQALLIRKECERLIQELKYRF
jgi:hypothetical protein